MFGVAWVGGVGGRWRGLEGGKGRGVLGGGGDRWCAFAITLQEVHLLRFLICIEKVYHRSKCVGYMVCEHTEQVSLLCAYFCTHSCCAIPFVSSFVLVDCASSARLTHTD